VAAGTAWAPNTVTYSAQKLHACIGAAVVTCNAGFDARIIHQVGALLISPYGHIAVQSSDVGFGLCCSLLMQSCTAMG